MGKPELKIKDKIVALKEKWKKAPKKKKIIIIAIVLVLILAIVLLSVKSGKKNSSTETTTSTAQKMTIEKTISSDGEIGSAAEESLAPHTSYYLEEINVSEGDGVKEGDPILTYTNGYTMDAPYDCVVQSWYLPDLGDQITTDHYVSLAGSDVLQMELSVSEDEVNLISVGDTANITVEAVSGTYEGEVSYVSQVGNYSGGSSTFTAKVNFENDGNIKLGMTGSAEIVLDKAENVIGIPVEAVHASGDGYYVEVKNGSKTEEVTVETGISNDSYIEIKSGLSEGDTIVVPVSDDSSGNSGFPGGGGMDFGGGGNMPSGGGNMPSGGGGTPPSGGPSGGSK